MLNENAITSAFAASVPPVVDLPTDHVAQRCDYCKKQLTVAEYRGHVEATDSLDSNDVQEWMCDACAEGTTPEAPQAPQPAAPQVTDAAKALIAKRDAKVDAIVRQLKPAKDDKYAVTRYAKGLPVGTMAVKVHSYFKDLYRAARPNAADLEVTNAVNSLIAGALDRGVIWFTTGGMNVNTKGSLKWYYSSAEYARPVSKAVLAAEKAKAEAAELGW